MGRSKAYLEADHIIEGVLARAELGIDPPLDTEDKWRGRMMAAIAEARSIGATEEEIEESIRLNLRIYNYAHETFPVEEWLA